MTDTDRVSDPLTVVTGGRGIGAAVVRRLAADGHDVVIAFRADWAAAERLVADVRTHGREALAVQADVSRAEDVDRLFETVATECGPLSGLVNNAGLTAYIGPLADTPLEAIRRVLEVNLLGTILCARAAVRAMSTAYGGAGGAIVNVSSSAATLGSPGEYVHYAAAKAGVDTFTVGLAKEVAGEGIRVNAVAPGLVNTGIHADAGEPGRAARVAERVPLGRPGEPTEIAPAVAWLLSEEAGYVTGAVLRVAGGL